MLDFNWLSSISSETAKWIFLVLFILIGILIVCLPGKYIWAGAERRVWWMNLKLWAIVVLSTIFLTYLFL